MTRTDTLGRPGSLDGLVAVGGSPSAIRFVLGHDLPVILEVAGSSMAPALPKGVKVQVAPVEEGDPEVGDLVVFETNVSGVIVLHRVMHLLSKSGRRFIMHQGDAPASRFGVSPRDSVVARVVRREGSDLPLPTVETLSASARVRFLRRRLACVAYAAASQLANSLGLERTRALRRCAQFYRSLAARVAG